MFGKGNVVITLVSADDAGDAGAEDGGLGIRLVEMIGGSAGVQISESSQSLAETLKLREKLVDKKKKILIDFGFIIITINYF